ncbi:hypothetical protein LTV02_30915 [Nocardia yamanashiensis]|uniref:hypothetical protein n=1 Tax=Nocardia yamanashiensis TaxID=209247 RepID=UPI001E38D7C4|nr:hypothetical protein [Nocardia yamanashiensis]UGT40384.1 hypothetical protein LTV02_30915 [Nocardia yamanashiensis]
MLKFDTQSPITATVEVASAEVTVIASDRTDAVVHIHPADPAKKADVRAAEQTQVDFTAGVLTVKTLKTWRTKTAFGGNPSIQVTVEVPTGSALKATAGVGRLIGLGALGESDLEVSAGDIYVERPVGSVTATVAKGDIRIGEATRGILRLETSVGELEVGIRPGSAARVETNVAQGAVHNHIAPADRSPNASDTVQVYARNTLGNIIIGHSVAA